MATHSASSESISHAPPRRWLSPVETWLVFGFWTFVAVLTAGSRLLDPRLSGLQFGMQTGPVLLAFVEAYLWMLLTPVVFRLSQRFPLDAPGRRVARAAVLLAVGIVMAILVDVTADLLRVYVFPLPHRRPPQFSPLDSISHLWFLNDLVVFLAVLTTGFARDYFLRDRARQAQTAQLQAQLAEARLQALRMQINPHFLFNTLHAVSSMVERDPRGVRRMIARLSELLRYTLEGASEQEVPLAQEMKFLDGYLDIMRVRFQGRLEATLEVDDAVREALVPNLILQPLVENAIQHGASKVEEGTGIVEVGAERTGEILRLRVRDNGPFAPGAAPLAEGVGLANTRARLEQLYGAGYGLALRPAEGGGLLAELTLPYHTRAELVHT